MVYVNIWKPQKLLQQAVLCGVHDFSVGPFRRTPFRCLHLHRYFSALFLLRADLFCVNSELFDSLVISCGQGSCIAEINLLLAAHYYSSRNPYELDVSIQTI